MAMLIRYSEGLINIILNNDGIGFIFPYGLAGLSRPKFGGFPLIKDGTLINPNDLFTGYTSIF